ncbi:MAG TPA: phage virion morphogenesis protein [Solirubrobacterales bacterium]|nr:phage virion morphogenesis protein [Solirubrobacterales bacterium]
MLREMGSRAEVMRPAMLRIKQLLIEGNTKQWRSKGAYMGTPWPENSPETVARKGRTGVRSLASTMVESGDLQESLEGGAGSFARVSKGNVRVGTYLYYAIFHIKGASGKGAKSAGSTPARKGGVPARPPLGITEADRTAAVKIIEDYLIGRRRG